VGGLRPLSDWVARRTAERDGIAQITLDWWLQSVAARSLKAVDLFWMNNCRRRAIGSADKQRQVC
jgi:hypothetical protein